MKIKLKNRFKILFCNAYVVLLFIAIAIAIPLQFVLFLFKSRKKVIRPLEDRVFKTLFFINDLRKNV